MATVAQTFISIDDLQKLAGKYFDKGEFNQALEYWSKIISIDENNKRAWNEKGLILYKLNKLHEAIECFDKAIALDKNYKEPYNNKGLALRKLGELSKALENYNKALEIRSDYKEAINNKGFIFKEQGNLKEALIYFDKALDIDPNYDAAKKNRASVLRKLESSIKEEKKTKEEVRIQDQKPLPNATPSVKQANHETICNNADALLLQGKALRNLKMYSEALAACNQALEINPMMHLAWLEKGEIHFEQNNFNDAIKFYKMSLLVKPTAQALIELGCVYAELGDKKLAMTHFDQAIVLNPNDINGWFNKAVLYHNNHEFLTALIFLDKTLSLAPDHAVALKAKQEILSYLQSQAQKTTKVLPTVKESPKKQEQPERKRTTKETTEPEITPQTSSLPSQPEHTPRMAHIRKGPIPAIAFQSKSFMEREKWQREFLNTDAKKRQNFSP